MTFIIAEVGVNHNGDLNCAQKLVRAALNAGADAVKFQTFKTENLVSKNVEMASYQKAATGKSQSQFDMLKELELSAEAHFDLKNLCGSLGGEFLSTAFDLESLYFLVNEIKLNRLKISSGDLTNSPFLLRHAITGKDIILSTGMATMDEIRYALSVLAFGLTTRTEREISSKMFEEALTSRAGQEALAEKVTLLHCSTEYPANEKTLNIRAIPMLGDHFGVNVGYSDHSTSLLTPAIAVAAGATTIERHITLDKNMEGPDHGASTEVDDFKRIVRSIRETEIILGKPEKKTTNMEMANRNVARKYIIADCEIKSGDVFSADNLGIKRCGGTISPEQYWELLGRKATKNYVLGEPISEKL